MDDFFDIVSSEPKEVFEVDSESKAVRVVGKFFDKERELNALNAKYKEYMDRLNQWYEAEAQRRVDEQNRFLEMLRPYASVRVAQEHGRKSFRIPGAKIGFRTTEGSVQVTDEERAVEWAEENCPEAVKVKKTILKTPLKERLQEGEFVPGAHLGMSHTKMYIEEEDGRES